MLLLTKINSDSVTPKTIIKKKLKQFTIVAMALATLPVLGQEEFKDWHFKDAKADKIPGISYAQALTSVEGKTAKPVIVAVIDGGIDTTHEDLKDNLWINPNEIPGNGIDDDNNGYADDIYGWNFIGGPEGNVEEENMELTRLYREFKKAKAEGTLTSSSENWEAYTSIKEEYEAEFSEADEMQTYLDQLSWVYAMCDDLVSKHLGTKDYTMDQVRSIKTTNEDLRNAQEFFIMTDKEGLKEEDIKEGKDHFDKMVDFYLNLDFNPRAVVGDNPAEISDSLYGNNDVMGGDPSHGTHVAGIIGAVRNNDLGMDGIAANVKLMTIRAVPDGDERDKDIALGIRYAVNNGADVINMSFGKYYSPHSQMVFDAIAYAERNGVIMVHAAGNDALDIDGKPHFPTKSFSESNSENKYWIEVGASSSSPKKTLPANFSNYGNKTVDIFAPGVDIYSCVPGSEYKAMSGTSMAAPVVTGVVALVLNYYPEMDHEKVKEILVNAGADYSKKKVYIPIEEGKPGKTKFSELSNSGKVLNAAEAMKLSNEMLN